MKMRTIGGALVAVALGFAASPSYATATTFTWKPAGALPALSGAEFSASGLNLSNYATVLFNPAGGGFTETAYELVTGFQSGGSTITPGGYGSTYSLFFAITATGNQTEVSAGNYIGSFSSVNYTLYATTTPLSSLTPTFDGSHNVSLSTGGDTALATGSLASGPNSVSLIGGTPTATATVTILPSVGEDGFFVAPPNYNLVLAQSNFSTTPSNVVVYPSGILTIGEVGTFGGGNANLSVVPEPASLAVLGAALVFLGVAIRRRQA